MDNERAGLKELYDVNIRLNDPVEIGNRKYDINETILSFDKAQIVQIQQNKNRKQARGGFNNNLQVEWEVDKETTFAITKGTLSLATWALISNSKIVENKYKSVPFQEELTVIDNIDNCFVDLKYIPNHVDGRWGLQGNPDNEPLPMGRKPWLPLKPLPPQRDKFLFCYDAETGNRIMNFDVVGNRIIFKAEHKKVMVDYTFDFDDRVRELGVGNRLFNGFLNLTAKMTIKNYWNGQPTTAILEIPKIKLSSNLALRLGEGVDQPVVSDLYFIGYPEEGRYSERKVFTITLLDKELTGDYE